MDAPDTIHKLVERFNRNLDDYRSGRYKEAQLRSEFINPFFIALGWDVNNEQGWAEAYKEVIHEYSQKIGDSPKAPDYCFRIGGQNKFFVEAKKPVVDIKSDINPAFQLRRYAWSAKLPLSILTDFEEFAVYDCRVKPSKDDKASKARITYFKYADYIEKWDDICSVFSPVEIRKGSFDRYADTTKKKRGTAEVDDAFLEDIEAWRDVLAKHIILRNSTLTVHQLNRAVQVTIDRIIFLRICEDRGIEPYGRLRDILGDGGVYPKLVDLFRNADDRYNSGLFHFQKERDRPDPDNLTPKLKVDDKILRDILGRLYYPDSPYEFSVLPADILGQVYERFLGKVIRLTPGGRAKVEEKPEVRKAGGVYYTPTYIVDYIVEHTVGKLLEKKTPKKVEKLRILDPACGSGSFLIGAYQYLLDRHIDYYSRHKPDELARKRKPPIYKTVAGDWKLTTAERKRILLNNIYGVDIDTQAVEVTKLSLLLKVLEDESKASLDNQLHLLHERALPDLSDNIKCGNSLIGTDYYDNTQMSLLDDEESRRINVFDWETEFPEIFKGKNPGFDAVIGNPPYIRIQTLKEWAPHEVDFYKEKYKAAGKGNFDIYVLFVERGLDLLNKQGEFGFILPHKFFNTKYGAALRKLLTDGDHLSHIVHFGHQQVFKGASNYTCLLFLDKKSNDRFEFVKVDDLDEWSNTCKAQEDLIPANNANAAEWNFMVGGGSEIYEKLYKMPIKLGDIAHMFVGLQTSADNVFLFKEHERKSAKTTIVASKVLEKHVELESELLKPVIRSGNIGRYWAKPTALVLFPYYEVDGNFQLIPEISLKKQYPKTWSYLLANKGLLSGREHGKFKDCGWYQLYPKNLDEWEQSKIMLPYMVKRLSAIYDENHLYFVNVTTGGFGMTVDVRYANQKYITGLLNSNLIDWFFKKVSTTFRGGYFGANKQFLDQIPIRTIDFSNPSDKTRHDKMVKLIERMLKLNKQLHAKRKTQHEKTVIQRQIDATDKAIDKLVYELYGLTEDEIKIVEESVG